MVIKVNVMEKMELQKQVLLSYSVVYPDQIGRASCRERV